MLPSLWYSLLSNSCPPCLGWLWYNHPKLWQPIISRARVIHIHKCGPRVTTSSTDFSFQNLVFWNFWIFSGKNHFKKICHILNPNLTKLIPLNPLIKIFSTTSKAHSNSSESFSYNIIYFSMKKSFDIQELLHRKSKHHETKPCTPPPRELSKETKNTIWSIRVWWIT